YEGDKVKLKADIAALGEGIAIVCDDLGINPTSVYGITITDTSTPGSGGWFDDNTGSDWGNW
ncbi:MAG: hypothetical protein MUP22_07490, partial [Desulfobacterales bacterium]|nr:hypothetical protein [Desulfobacterales bacterium]